MFNLNEFNNNNDVKTLSKIKKSKNDETGDGITKDRKDDEARCSDMKGQDINS